MEQSKLRVWITGATGFLGRALQQVFQKKNLSFVATSKQDIDICDLRALLCFYKQAGPFTHIVNCAAYTQVDLAEIQRIQAYQVNGLGPAFLGWVARENGMQVVHLSTDYVFDGYANTAYSEGARENPQTVYGKTKWTGEKNLLAVLPHACILRTSWLFGTGGRHFISTLLARMREQKEIKVVCDQWGKPTYVKDLAKLILHALHWRGIFHCTNRGEVNRYAFAKVIAEEFCAMGFSLHCQKIIPIFTSDRKDLAPRPRYSALCTAKAEHTLGFSLRSWKEGMREYLKEEYESP